MVKMVFSAEAHIPEEGEWYTFDGWRELGFGVLKGEKARRFVNGVAVFHKSQVANLHISDDFDLHAELRGISWSPEWWKD